MSSHTWSFSGLTSSDGSLLFNSINAVEQDTGYFSAFFGAPNPLASIFNDQPGMEWSGYRFGVFGPSSSITVTLSYDVTAVPSEEINSVTQFYDVDEFTGLGIGASATETVDSMSGQTLGSTTWTATGTGAASSTVALSQPEQQVQVTLTINESISSIGQLLKSDVDISIVGQYFGESAAPASISSYVFCDTTGSGVYQSGDMLMSGVTVELFNSGGSLVASTVTGANGAYTFSNLAVGTYTTKVIAPTGDSISTSNNGVDTVTLTAGESDNAAPTGLDMPGVWSADVFYQGGTTDISLPGVTVTLETNSGMLVSSGITNANGNITFENLTVGDTYMVEVTTPAGDTVVASTNVNTADEVLSCGTMTSTETVTANNVASFTAGVAIVKSVTSVGGALGDPAATYAGEAIDYQVVVTNIGNETLTDVLVTDPTLGTTLASLASLAVGATVAYTASSTVTQAEIDSGNVIPNTAVVTDDQTPSQSSTVTTPVAQLPAVTIVKSVTAVGGASGDPAATYARRGNRLPGCRRQHRQRDADQRGGDRPDAGHHVGVARIAGGGCQRHVHRVDDGDAGRDRQRQRGTEHRGGDRRPDSVAVLDGHHAGGAVAGGDDREVGDLGGRCVGRSGRRPMPVRRSTTRLSSPTPATRR